MTSTSRPRARVRASALVLTGAIALGVTALAAPALADPSSATGVSLSPLGTFSTGAFDEGASEIVAYDAATQRAFVVNAQAGTVDVLDISDPTAPTKVATLATPGANSVAVAKGVVAVAEQADDKQQPGTVSFFDAASLTLTRTVAAGALPDMVALSEDGRYAVVANEGEPEGYEEGQVDPEGSVSVIDVRSGAVRTAGFGAWNDREAELTAAGVRIFGPGASVAQDLEPEYVAISGNGLTAYVTLQENNALAVVDLKSATVTDIRPLGTKDHSLAGQGLDASDKDDAITIANWPVSGLYLPDGIQAFRAGGGAEYLITANEGDAREYDGFEEEARVKDLTLDPTVFPNASALQKSGALGRLTVTTTAPQGPAGYTELQALGGRSVSIRDAATGALVWDSGDDFEQLIAQQAPEFFNADHAENDSVDSRSDNKGPEPEGVEIGRVNGRTLAFVGLERNSGIVVVDVTDPTSPSIVGYAHNRIADGDPEAGTAGDLGPEGLHFIPKSESPTGEPLLLVGNEVSGTTTVWQVG
ncbi:choice-of-anchor I family protein [Janibacter sp. G56]|uniref:choice-of-anchor I family protein n=1 Tax=Janibacter sp. G56 TaxID=3418717 RepID=UPI003D0433F6